MLLKKICEIKTRKLEEGMNYQPEYCHHHSSDRNLSGLYEQLHSLLPTCRKENSCIEMKHGENSFSYWGRGLLLGAHCQMMLKTQCIGTVATL